MTAAAGRSRQRETSTLDPGLPRYTVAELNRSIGALLERGFAPRFLVEATVSRPQLKKGHLWLSLVDGSASIPAVVWASQLERISLRPEDGDGVIVVGKLNFWVNRASLCVQVLDLRPSLSAVLRRFEAVRQRLEPEGLLDPARKRPLPQRPERIALLTSVPSAALADMLRTAAERWPSTALVLVPIPVQGAVEEQICRAVRLVGERATALGLEALVLARGGGSREDLTVFDGEQLARCLAACPIPVVTGLGHEDDTTVADLVSDYRAATPTAAIVSLLPDRQDALRALAQERLHLKQQLILRLRLERHGLADGRRQLEGLHPRRQLATERQQLEHRRTLLQALSPQGLLARGFCLLSDATGRIIHRVAAVQPGQELTAELIDGKINTRVISTAPGSTA